ncbi:MAG: MFS transporter [Nocardioides sp.]|nr:MFS transporter [Nocardioides sp.]
MLSPYRRVLSLPGTWQFSLSGFFGRLPTSMVSLGIVLLVSTRTGSYGLAGTVASAYLLAQAAFAILHGRLADRFGQARVLAIAQLVFTTSVAMMMWSVEAGWSNVVVHLFAMLGGAAFPQVGSCVRARWSHAVHDARQVQTAYAFESVVDEAMFVTGPTIVTFLATAWHPLAGLSAALVSSFLGTMALALQTRTDPGPHDRAASSGPRPAMPWRIVAPMAAVSLAMGVVFGAAEVITVAFTQERDLPQWAGPLLGVWAIGSLTAGLVTGLVMWRSRPEVRVQVGVLALGLTQAPLILVDSIWLLGFMLLLGGMAIAPTLIATLAVIEQNVPRGRLTEGMSILHTAMGFGIAPGATLSGLVVDGHGASPAYVVPAAAALLGAVAAWTGRAPVTSTP